MEELHSALQHYTQNEADRRSRVGEDKEKVEKSHMKCEQRDNWWNFYLGYYSQH